MRKHGFISIAILILASCASNPGYKGPETLYGMIYDNANRPVNNVHIYDNGTYAATSDINGHFVIPQIRLRREHTISARKENYETLEMDVLDADPTNVLYMRMFSGDQLLAEAEKSLGEKDWSRAESFLARSERAGGNRASIRYLQGALAFCKGEYREALSILGALGEQEKNPYVYLFIADIYQYHIKNQELAHEFLGKFLERRYDPGVQNRFEETGIW
jgi:hypothetical protein